MPSKQVEDVYNAGGFDGGPLGRPGTQRQTRFTPENTRRLGKVKVFLDGVEMTDVFEADTEQGFVVVADRTSDGRLKLSSDMESIATRRLTGKVKVMSDRGWL